MKSTAANMPSFHNSVSLASIILLSWCFFTANSFVPSIIRLGLISPPSSTMICESSSSRNNASRREILQNSFSIYLAAVMMPSTAFASNLPDSTGADLSKTGSIDTLIPIVAIQRSLLNAKLQLSDSKNGSPSSIATPETCAIILHLLLKCIPREEKVFKRIFDAYSTPVSYKQKFLDQNAFLVYYTKGYDGPGRPNIEEDTNNVQTLQYGSRNDAWNSMDDLFVELEFGKGSKDDSALSNQGELVALIDKVSTALDSYISLAPVADVDEARQLGQ